MMHGKNLNEVYGIGSRYGRLQQNETVMKRNDEIILAVRQGATMASQARKFGISASSVRAMVVEANYIPDVFIIRPRPDCMSLKSAVAVFEAIGCWPDNENADRINERRLDILRSCRAAARVLKEVDTWLASIGIPIIPL
jgi:hypothetical protein